MDNRCAAAYSASSTTTSGAFMGMPWKSNRLAKKPFSAGSILMIFHSPAYDCAPIRTPNQNGSLELNLIPSLATSSFEARSLDSFWTLDPGGGSWSRRAEWFLHVQVH